MINSIKILSLSAIFVFVVEPAYAKMPGDIFKDVTTFFRPGMENYSPTLGQAALDMGFVENLLFYGPFEAAYDPWGYREYIDDTSTNPWWNVAKILFPSNDGELGAVFDADTNFARVVTSPKTIALLVNFAKQVYDLRGKSTLAGKVIQQSASEIIATLDLRGMGASTRETFRKKTINALLTHVRDGIMMEKRANSFFPKYTIVQLIQSFFCYHFNGQSDIWAELSHLDDTIVDKSRPFPVMVDRLRATDLDVIAAKPSLGLDDIFNLSNEHLFKSVPYRTNASLLSNGTTKSYSRTTASFLPNETFQDCVEVTLRHILNLFLFNSTTRKFDLSMLEANISRREQETGRQNPYLAGLRDFYAHQTVELANAGDINTRSLFNKVINNLPQADYRRGSGNEIRSGFVNILTTFATLFDLELKPIPAQIDDKKQWLVESFKTLFEMLNPLFSCAIYIEEIEEFDNDIIGKFTVVVRQVKTYEKLFSFCLSSTLWANRGHTKATALKLFFIRNKSYDDALAKHSQNLVKNSTQESLMVLSNGALPRDVHPIYALFRETLVDNPRRLRFLRRLIAQTKRLATSPQNINFLELTTRNVLRDIDWNELRLYTQVYPVIALLKDIDVLSNVLGEEIPSLVDETVNLLTIDFSSSNISVIKGLRDLPKVVELKADNSIALEEIEFDQTLKSVRYLDLNNSSVKKIVGLEYLPRLRGIKLKNTKQLTKLAFSRQFEFMHTLDLKGSSISEIDGLENLPNVKYIYLSNTNNLQRIEFKGTLSQIEWLTVEGSGIREIVGFESLPNLHSVTFKDCPNLKKLVFHAHHPNLHKIVLTGSGVEQVEGLEHLRKLKELKVDRCMNLNRLLFTARMPKLQIVDLTESAIEAIDGLSQLSALSKLYLSQTKNLSSIEFSESNRRVTCINLSDSAITNLAGLKYLEMLGSLHLTNSHNVDELEFSSQNKRGLILYLRGTKFKKFEDLKGFEFLNPRNINF